MQQLPKIIIEYNRLLDPIFSFYCQNNPEFKKTGWNDWRLPAIGIINKRINNYRIEWQKYEEKILNSIINCTGFGFKINIIKVHIVSGNPRQISDPLIIKSGYKPDEFVDVLTHELIHHIFTLNEASMNIYNEKYTENESTSVKRHVIVNAIMKYVYLDIFNDSGRLNRDIKNSENNTVSKHFRAWEIVQKNNYKEIISNLKNKTGLNL